MVFYIYSLEYSDETATSDNNKLVCNAKMFEAAEFYIIPHLQKLAAAKFKTAVSETYAVDYFLEAIRVIYANPTIDHTLRNLVAEACVKEHSTLIAHQGFIDVLSDIPELGKDLVLNLLPAAAKADKLSMFDNMYKKTCRYCETQWVQTLSYGQMYCPNCKKC
jgi:hypothetical protein